jgi:hypothetical protein
MRQFWKIGNRKFDFRRVISLGLFLVVLLATAGSHSWFQTSAVAYNPIAYKPSVANVDLHHIPIGDGRISTKPEQGFVWSCRTQFGGPRRHGAHASGNWIHQNATYDFTTKPTVNGNVYWPGDFNIAMKDNQREIISNRLPQDPTGNFPISPKDDAYAFDRNPNSIRSVSATLNLTANPELAAEPTCLPMGQVGILLNGGYLFNALDANGKDAVAHEIQDSCQGHPEHRGTYHYHSITTCLDKRDRGKGHSALLGYALDGFGIYGHRSEGGKVMTNNDLDVCHGHTHEVEWDGKKLSKYHYHATWEYPYTLGCYRGTPVKLARPPRLDPPPMPPPGDLPPPPPDRI